jgi:hypothetical protein
MVEFFFDGKQILIELQGSQDVSKTINYADWAKVTIILNMYLVLITLSKVFQIDLTATHCPLTIAGLCLKVKISLNAIFQ